MVKLLDLVQGNSLMLPNDFPSEHDFTSEPTRAAFIPGASEIQPLKVVSCPELWVKITCSEIQAHFFIHIFQASMHRHIPLKIY